MFNTTSQQTDIDIDSVAWKERHPSFVMNVVKVSVRDFENQKYYRAEYYKVILLEDDKGAKLESEIPNDFAELIKTNRKYRIWYDFYDTAFRGCRDTEILCIEVQED